MTVRSSAGAAERENRVHELRAGRNGDLVYSYIVGALLSAAKDSPDVAAALDQALTNLERDTFFGGKK